jgi:hypothetical protein
MRMADRMEGWRVLLARGVHRRRRWLRGLFVLALVLLPGSYWRYCKATELPFALVSGYRRLVSHSLPRMVL